MDYWFSERMARQCGAAVYQTADGRVLTITERTLPSESPICQQPDIVCVAKRTAAHLLKGTTECRGGRTAAVTRVRQG